MHDDSAERERYRLLLRDLPLPPASAHPASPTPLPTTDPIDPELIWRAASGELDSDTTRALLDRSIRDPEAALAWQMALEMRRGIAQADADADAEAEADADAEADVRSRVGDSSVADAQDRDRTASNVVPLRAPRRATLGDRAAANDNGAWRGRTPIQRVAPWALAAGLALALAGTLVLGPQDSTVTSPADVLRGGDEVATLRAVSAEEQPRGDLRLEWSDPAADPAGSDAVDPSADPSTDAPSYRIWVTTEDLSPVASARDLEEPSYAVPAEALADLPDGTRLLWRVEAQVDGETIESDTFVVRLVDP